MEIKQEIFFYRLHVQIDESHWEETFMTIGKPEKSIKEVQQEAEDDFYFALSEFEEVQLHDILYQKLEKYGYLPIRIEDAIYYDEPEFSYNSYAKKMIQAKIGEDYYDEDFKHRLNDIRIQRGKQPYPMPKKEEKPSPAVIIEREKDELFAIEDFDTFIEVLRKKRDREVE